MMTNKKHLLYFKPQSGGDAPNPILIANLQGWYNSDNVIHTSNVISQVTDLSSNNNHLTQSDTTKRPVLQANIQNSKPAIKFDGTNDAMLLTTGINLNNSSCFFVVRMNANTTQAFISGLTGGSLMFRWNNLRMQLIHSFVTDIATSTVNLAQNTTYILHFDISNGAGGNCTFYNKNVTQGNTTTNRTMNASNQIGADGNGQYLNAQVFEMIFYNRVLNSTERSDIVTFLSNKYAI